MVMIFQDEAKLVKLWRATWPQKKGVSGGEASSNIDCDLKQYNKLHMCCIEAFDTFAELFHGGTTLSYKICLYFTPKYEVQIPNHMQHAFVNNLSFPFHLQL